MHRVVLVVHNVRSSLNVGSLLRTAEGLGIEKVFLTGYTPYPETKDDSRLPHIRRKVAGQIHKTALGAEEYISWEHMGDIGDCLNTLSAAGYMNVALEQTEDSVSLDKFVLNSDVALVVGNEVTGLEDSVLEQIKYHIQIPMSGRKESFNVAVAAGIAMYHLRFVR